MAPFADIGQHSAESTGLMRSVATMRRIGDEYEGKARKTKADRQLKQKQPLS
jgi:hypothetical protein